MAAAAAAAAVAGRLAAARLAAEAAGEQPLQQAGLAALRLAARGVVVAAGGRVVAAGVALAGRLARGLTRGLARGRTGRGGLARHVASLLHAHLVLLAHR